MKPAAASAALAFLVTVLGGLAAAVAAEVPARPSAGCAAPAAANGRRLERTIVVSGVSRSYVLDVPASTEPSRPVPLLFDFHGLGHSGGGVWAVSEFRQLAERDGFITVYPDGLTVTLNTGTQQLEGTGWEIAAADSNRDLKFTALLLDHLEATYCIDRARVFATGFSNGAFFSHLLGCVMADRFAAIAPVSGGRAPAACAPSRGVAVLIYHGRQDQRVPVQHARVARDAWLALNRCREHASNGCEEHRQCRDGAVVEYCEADFAHRWPALATAHIWEFFQAHPLAAAARGPPAILPSTPAGTRATH
ncbi:MAG: hypothetical protein HY699_20045 [Deltaproteobacteria bacterium]|nr:hypothetical protein [Deltaproteobacteria bacterium]